MDSKVTNSMKMERAWQKLQLTTSWEHQAFRPGHSCGRVLKSTKKNCKRGAMRSTELSLAVLRLNRRYRCLAHLPRVWYRRRL